MSDGAASAQDVRWRQAFQELVEFVRCLVIPGRLLLDFLGT
jgi:hypothetical protein